VTVTAALQNMSCHCASETNIKMSVTRCPLRRCVQYRYQSERQTITSTVELWRNFYSSYSSFKP